MNCKTCSLGLNNTGAKYAADYIVQQIAGAYFVPTYDADGNPNSIDPTVEIDQAFVTGKLNETPDKRWYPVFEFDEVERVSNEDITQTTAANRIFKIEDGTRTFQTNIYRRNAIFLGKVEDLACQELSVIYVDDCGAHVFSNQGKGDSVLYPIQIEDESFRVRDMPKTNTTEQSIMLEFQIYRMEQDKYIRVISRDELNADYNPFMQDGLYDISIDDLNVASSTEMTFKVSFCYGSMKDGKKLVTGLVAADMSIFNVTQNGAVPIANVSENAVTREYTVEFTAQTASEIGQLTVGKEGLSPTTSEITFQ